MNGLSSEHKSSKILILYAIAVTFLGAMAIVFSPAFTKMAYAVPAEFYSAVGGSTGGTGTPTPCQSGDFSLTPGVNFPQGSLHCLRMPAGSINTQATAQPNGTTTCPPGFGGLNLGGFGFHCLPNDPAHAVYIGGRPILTTAAEPTGASGGTTSDACAGTTATSSNCVNVLETGDTEPNNDQCGNQDADGNGSVVNIGFNIGCKGADNEGPMNPIMDMLFAAIRFLSAGVGLIIIGSLIFGGFQYLTSQGEPQKIQAASLRVLNTAIALGIYLVAFAFLNWVIPGGLFL